MSFDPLDSGDYHRVESTTSSSSSNKASGGNGGSTWGWQPILGWVIIIVTVVALVRGVIANMP